MLGLVCSSLLSSCAINQFSRRFPDATAEEQSFVRFLCHGGNMTPSQVRDYLRSKNIVFKLKQDGWLGEDHWQIAGFGKWVAHYTGRKGFPQMIPGDINLFYNQTYRPATNGPLPIVDSDADFSMFVYYDTMTSVRRGFSVRFDREKNLAITEQDGDGKRE